MMAEHVFIEDVKTLYSHSLRFQEKVIKYVLYLLKGNKICPISVYVSPMRHISYISDAKTCN